MQNSNSKAGAEVPQSTEADVTTSSQTIAKPNVVRRFSRERLIRLCMDAVVHHTKWDNRDSLLAQRSIQSIYEGLTAGLKFKVVTNDDTLIVEFLQPIDFAKLKNGLHLEISSREDYFKDCCPDFECEMFDGDGIDFQSSYTESYMPTRQRLENVGIGNDWY